MIIKELRSRFPEILDEESNDESRKRVLRDRDHLSKWKKIGDESGESKSGGLVTNKVRGRNKKKRGRVTWKRTSYEKRSKVGEFRMFKKI